MKKIILAVLGVALLALVVVYFRLGAIAKSVIETHGSKVAGVPVKVGTVILSPFSGKARISSLEVGNPEGFKSPAAFKLRDVHVALDIKTLRGGGPLRIHEIVIDGPEVTYEAGPGGSNLARIQKNLESYSPKTDETSQPQEKAQAQRKVELGLFKVTDGRVTASLPQLKEEQRVNLPTIELKDLSGTAAEVSKQALSQVTKSAMKASGGVEALLEQGAKALGGEAGKAVDKLRGLLYKKKK